MSHPTPNEQETQFAGQATHFFGGAGFSISLSLQPGLQLPSVWMFKVLSKQVEHSVSDVQLEQPKLQGLQSWGVGTIHVPAPEQALQIGGLVLPGR